MKIQQLLEAKKDKKKSLKVSKKSASKSDPKFDKFIAKLVKKTAGGPIKYHTEKAKDGTIEHLFTDKKNDNEWLYACYYSNGQPWVNWASGGVGDYYASGNDPLDEFLAGKMLEGLKPVKKSKKTSSPIDDFDDSEEAPVDPELDKVPHIIIQLRKALDVDGNYPILFKDGTKTKLSMDTIRAFLIKYISAKPIDREKLQDAAAESPEGLEKAAGMEVAQAPKSIYTETDDAVSKKFDNETIKGIGNMLANHAITYTRNILKRRLNFLNDADAAQVKSLYAKACKTNNKDLQLKYVEKLDRIIASEATAKRDRWR